MSNKFECWTKWNSWVSSCCLSFFPCVSFSLYVFRQRVTFHLIAETTHQTINSQNILQCMIFLGYLQLHEMDLGTSAFTAYMSTSFDTIINHVNVTNLFYFSIGFKIKSWKSLSTYLLYVCFFSFFSSSFRPDWQEAPILWRTQCRLNISTLSNGFNYIGEYFFLSRTSPVSVAFLICFFFNSNSTVIENMINFSSTNQIEQRDQENGFNRKKNKREYVKQTISCRNMPKTQTKEPATQKTSQSNERLFQTYLNVAIYLKKTVKKGFTRLNEKPQCNYSITN